MNEEKKFVKTEITTLQGEVSGDYILPDSYPDVKSILSSSARIYDIKHYYGANDAEITGNVAYNIMFSSSDSEGADVICSVSFTDELKLNCRYKYPTNIGVGTQTRLRELNCRMANPRKFSIKSQLETLMYEDVCANAYPALPDSAPSDADMQYKWDKMTVCRVRSAQLCEHSFSDNIELDIKMPEIDKIVHCDAVINVRDERGADINQSSPKLGGVLTLDLVYSDKEGKNASLCREIPFGISINEDESAMIGELDANTSMLPCVYISALNINIGKNGYDEAKVIEFDADYDIDLLIFSSADTEYVTDAYSTKYASECKCEAQTLIRPLARIKNNFTYSDVHTKDEYGIENTSLLYSSIPTLAEIHTEKNGDFVNITGKMCEKATLINDDTRIRAKDIVKPFTYKSSVNIKNEEIGMLGGAIVADSRLRTDSERVYTDAEIYLDYLLTGKQSISICKSVSLSTSYEGFEEKEMLCIYYPDVDESIWQTAKMKKTTVENITRLNPGIEEGSGQPMIIE